MGRAEGHGRLFYMERRKRIFGHVWIKTLDDLPPLSEENEQMNEADLFFGSLQEISK